MKKNLDDKGRLHEGITIEYGKAPIGGISGAGSASGAAAFLQEKDRIRDSVRAKQTDRREIYGLRIIAHPLKFVHSRIRSTPYILFANSLSTLKQRIPLLGEERTSNYSQTGSF